MPNPIKTAAWFAMIVLSLLSPVFAAQDCAPFVARFVSIEGQVEVRHGERKPWVPVSIRHALCLGDQIRVGESARASIELNNDTILRLDQNSTLIFPRAAQDRLEFLDLIKGALHLISRVRGTFEIRTPYVNAGLEGTEFVVRVLDNETLVSVLEGQVKVSNAFGSLRLSRGQIASGSKNAAPVLRLDLKPEDAVQWAIHYPVITDPDRQGVAPEILDAQRLLSVGQADAARARLEGLLQVDAPDPAALALASVISLAQNASDEALVLSERAVEAAPNDSSAQLAVSYARQARFDLPGAESAVQAALDADPDNALAWARLAELYASRGDTRAALGAAEKGQALAPDLSRTQSVLGFMALTRLQLDKADSAFAEAVRLDPADPLPRMGLALIKIRRGMLAEGRRDLEIAASLDPVNPLIRSYLGKAYVEEHRDREAAVELERAKQLDPLDPTPWLLDAVRKQAGNRPVEAVEDLQRSIALNNNRAIYRSGLLLEEDAATRNASLASIFRDIGLEQRALALGTRSLATDPTNASAHRLLADAHVGAPRRGIAQVSQLLQAQLYQPLSSRPVAPQSLIRELDNSTGLALRSAGLNEYTALFDREGPRLHAGALVGNRDTAGGEFLVSGLADRFAYSTGYFKFDTDGFRDGADVTQETYNGFLQARISDDLDLQLELRNRNTQQGDLRLRLDPTFVPNERRTLDQDTYRIGAHFRPSAKDDLVASLIWTERDATLRQDGLVQREVTSTRDAYSAEAQYIRRWKHANAVIGGGVYRIDVDETRQVTIPSLELPIPPVGLPMPPVGLPTPPVGLPIPPVGLPIPSLRLTNPPQPVRNDFDVSAENLYLYTNLETSDETVWTLGVSHDNYSDDGIGLDVNKWNPKIGVQWQPTAGFQARAAYLTTLKRELTVDQNLEPTQVAGFNQFFDDFNGTFAKLYGIGFDWDISKNLLASIELTKRDTEKQDDGQRLDEHIVRGQVSWIINKEWTGSLGLFSDESEVNGRTGRLDLKTRIFPLGLQFHDPRGAFGRVTASYVEQDAQIGSAPEIDEQFGLLDLAVGYRLPKDRGRITLEVNNVFDKAFLYQDDGYKTSDAFNVYRPFFPARLIRLSMGIRF